MKRCCFVFNYISFQIPSCIRMYICTCVCVVQNENKNERNINVGNNDTQWNKQKPSKWNEDNEIWTIKIVGLFLGFSNRRHTAIHLIARTHSITSNWQNAQRAIASAVALWRSLDEQINVRRKNIKISNDLNTKTV